LALSTFIRLGSDFGAAATVRAFLDQCGAVDAGACAFSAGTPEATRKKWADLLERARAGLTLDGDAIDDRAIAAYVQSSIYLVDPLPGFGRLPRWAAVGAFLQQAWAASGKPAAGPAASDAAPADAAP